MANGQQLSDQNYATFQAWLASKADVDFRAMASRGVLSRKEIAAECGFAKSALDQNPRIKAALRAAEDELRARGILPEIAEKAPNQAQEPRTRLAGTERARRDAERLRRLEQENASLRAEVEELRRLLDKQGLLKEALTMSGRLPR